MTSTEILATLHKAGIVTVGDLDAWARIRKLSRWEALSVILGVSAADHVLALLVVRQIDREGI